MDKESNESMMARQVASEGDKRRHFFSIWLVHAVGEKREQIFEN